MDEGIESSMSRKGNYWDNTVIGPFFIRLKAESVHAEKFAGLDDAYASVFEYIKLFYNNIKRYSTNGYKSHKEYERIY